MKYGATASIDDSAVAWDTWSMTLTILPDRAYRDDWPLEYY